jgi:hypothetical protein
MLYFNTRVFQKARISILMLFFISFANITIGQWRSDPFARSVVFVPTGFNEICTQIEFQIEIGNGGTAADPILPGQVRWQINFPFDVMITGLPTNLPPQLGVREFVCDPTAGGGVGETRVLIEVLQDIAPTTNFILRFPAWGIIPNVPGRQITSQVVLIPDFVPFSGNLDPNNDNSNAPIEFRPRSCVPYRTVKSGNWNDLTLWETFGCVTRDNTTCTVTQGGWSPATQLPPSGSASILIRHDVVQNINFTVANCPLTLDNASGTTSKLTINPQITLGFNGGPDGNAYFNSRPVVVKSTADGTGAIGRMLSNSQTNGDDNVTVERFLPEGPQRRWNLLTFGVRGNATIRDAWAGGSRTRISTSLNRNGPNVQPYGNIPKPNNVPFPMPSDYVPGDGTIITGHRHADATIANNGGYDWWPELIIPAGERWYTTPDEYIVVNTRQTTPASIRPYRPSATSDFGAERGTAWISNGEINTGFGGQGLINMNLSNAYDQHRAFMLFTRGDRAVLENWYNSTTLRPTGTLMKQSVTSSISGGVLNVLGNPFPAPIDFQNVWNANTSVIEPYFYFWNSQLNGTSGHGAWEVVYRVLVQVGIDPDTGDPIFGPAWRRSANITPPNFGGPGIGGGTTAAGNNSARVINSSQGVMVQGTTAGGSLVLTEAMKTSIANTTNFRPFEQEPALNLGVLYTNLGLRNESSDNLRFVDAINILIADGFNENLSDKSDIKKINSHTGNLGLSIKRDETLLMVESYPNPTTEAVFPLSTPGLTERAYSFVFIAENLYANGREIFLRDKFLNTLSEISTTVNTEYRFSGTADEASRKDDRFEIVLKSDNVLPVHFTRIHAEEINKDIRVNWGIQTEDNMDRYEVEHSRNGSDFGKAVNVTAKNESPASYEWLHVQPGVGDHFYRIRAFSKDGRNLTTQIVKVAIGGAKEGGFKVFPTVVTKAMDVNIQLQSLEKGTYTLQVLDMAGRVITTENIQHNGGSAAMLLKLPQSLSSGQYQIRLFNENVNFVEPIFRNR